MKTWSYQGKMDKTYFLNIFTSYSYKKKKEKWKSRFKKKKKKICITFKTSFIFLGKYLLDILGFGLDI